MRSYVYLNSYTQIRDRGGTMCPPPGVNRVKESIKMEKSVFWWFPKWYCHCDSCLWRAWPDRQQEPIWFDLFPPSLPWPAIGWQVSKNQQKKQKNKYWYFQEETINRGSQSGPWVDTWWWASLPLSGQEEKHFFFLQLISFLRRWHNSSTKFEYEYEDIFLLFLQLQVQVEQLCFTCYSY